MDTNRFVTRSLHDPRMLRVLSAALQAVNPYVAVQKNLPKLDGRVFGLGIGKAAIPMMDALADQVPLAGALAVTKFASRGTSDRYTATPNMGAIGGGHPIPDARSVQAGEKVLEFVSSLKEDDTLVCLISGGGSALVTAPFIPLADLQALTSLLLSSGASIDEINTLRRQLDRIKGGGLARATKARIIGLILSDVIGNPLEAIASGPTAPNPTTQQDALKILDRYSEFLTTQTQRHGEGLFLNSVTKWLQNSRDAKPDDSIFQRVQNIVIGDNELAAQAALRQAEEEGFRAEILTNALHGEAREVGVMLARKLFDTSTKRRRPFCLIAGGETTVTIRGQGKGGRNQELALSAIDHLRGMRDAWLVALATDGDDGPTDAAGAVVTGDSAERAESLGLNASAHLSRNDAYPFFQQLDDLIKTGPTGTNVNDLIFLFAI